jgi:hypothetical protein
MTRTFSWLRTLAQVQEAIRQTTKAAHKPWPLITAP